MTDKQNFVTNPLALKGTKVYTRETMMPRKLMLCIKVLSFVIAIMIIFLIITGLKTRNGWSNNNNVVNFEQDSNSLDSSHESVEIRHVAFNKETNSIIFYDANPNEAYLDVKLTLSEGATAMKLKLKSANMRSYSQCLKTAEGGQQPVLCLEFSNQFISAIYEEKNDSCDCHVVHWLSNSTNPTTAIEQCVDMLENWYGGGALSEHRWPLNRVDVPMQAYITQKYNGLENTNVYFESFLEPYFVSAGGVAVLLDAFLPLFISINNRRNKKICFRAVFDKPYSFPKISGYNTLLKYKVCKGKDARTIHEQLLKTQKLDHPLSQPNSDILQKPVWSTRGVDLKNIDQRHLLKYINDLRRSNLSFSQLFIDGNYSRSPGSVFFNEKIFPNSAQVIMDQNSYPIRNKLQIGTEVFPLIPKLMRSKDFSFLYAKTRDALYLDVSNKEAVKWFTSQLDSVMNEILVKGFRFSGGHAASPLLTVETIANVGMKRLLHPNQMTHEYGKIAGQFQGSSFLGSGFKSQKYGLIADSGPYFSTWNHCKGLKSIIPTVITYGIMGYPFVLVGPVGGVDYHVNSSSSHFSLPNRNLFLRWMQLSSFLPVMEFSVGPWQYDAQVLNYTQTLLTYRKNSLWPKYLSPAVKEATETGIPIIRPLWWIAPNDKTAQFIDCEFMLGDSLLVAPVLDAGQQRRQVYLPAGSWWQDQLRDGKLYKGGQWLNYHVNDFEIAHFIRTTSSTLNDH